jgi:transcriptional regulator with XRE-family HTH domain
MDIGQRVREIRKDLGMSAAELARRTGVARNTIVMIEAGRRTPSLGLVEKIAHELRREPADLLKEPVPLDEDPSPAGPEERRPSLDQVREVFAPLADGLNRYCARWEEKLPNLQGTYEEVADFDLDLQDFRAIIMRVLEDELYAIAEALDLGSRYGDESGLPRDMRLGFIRGEAEQHSLMHEAIKRCRALAHALAESIHNEEKAESMRQALAEAGV